MSNTYISASDRRLVRKRARGRCEYCFIHEDDTGFASADMETGCEIDHVIAEKHGGETNPDNLAYSCVACNRGKGSDIASLANDGTITRLYNPHTDIWHDHFRFEGARILPISPIGEATNRILAFNTGWRLTERQLLQALGRYPGS